MASWTARGLLLKSTHAGVYTPASIPTVYVNGPMNRNRASLLVRGLLGAVLFLAAVILATSAQEPGEAVLLPGEVGAKTASELLATPRSAVRTFLEAMDAVASGDASAMASALRCLYLDEIPERERSAAGADRARKLFEILNSRTVILEDIPEESSLRSIDLPLGFGDATITMRQYDDGLWRINSQSVERIPAYHEEFLALEASREANGVDEALQLNPLLLSPRTTMRTFLEGMHAWNEGGRDEALLALELSQVGEAVREIIGAVYAEQLKFTLDRFDPVVYQTLPDRREGDAYIHELPGIGRLVIARIDTGEPDTSGWKFTSDTLGNLSGYYREALELPRRAGQDDDGPRNLSLRVQSWVVTFAPSLLQQHFILETWQWIALFLIIFTGMLLARLFTLLLVGVLRLVFARGHYKLDVERVRKFATPIRLTFMAWVWLLGLYLLPLPPWVLNILYTAAITITYGGVIWAAYKLVDVVCNFLSARAAQTQNKFDDLLVPLVMRSLKLFVLIAGVVAIVSSVFPQSWPQLLAGLGIGGLAVALAARETLAHLFGSIMILADRPFEIGDWVQVKGVEGNVESVGIRSTAIRTFYNSRVTIPNSEIANSVIDNYGARRFRRIRHTLSLTYDTPPGKIEAFCEGIRELIRQQPYTRKDYFHVYFYEYGAASLDILVYCFIECPDWGTELRERHRLFLDILRLAERLSIEFAFPTQTFYMRREEEWGTQDPGPANRTQAFARGREEALGIVERTRGLNAPPPPPVRFDTPDGIEDIIKGDDGESSSAH